MSDSQLDLLRAESTTVRIGQMWLSEITEACVDVSHRFDPAVYAVAEATWSTSEIDELVQDVTVEQLLRQGQLDYILDIAEGITDVRRLLRHQVRRALVRRRRLTVVDRLISRISSILQEDYEAVIGITPTRFQPPSHDLGAAQPTDRQLRSATATVRLLPASLASGDRAPTVFRTKVLHEVIAKSFEQTGTSLALSDFGQILTDALTSWVPVVLELNEERDVVTHDDLDPELEQTAVMIRDDLDEDERLVLRTKLSGMSDSELASLLDISRPTAAKRKIDAFANLRQSWCEHASDLSPDVHSHLAQLLYLHLTEVATDE